MVKLTMNNDEMEAFELKTKLDGYLVSTVVVLVPGDGMVLSTMYETMVFASNLAGKVNFSDLDCERTPMEGNNHRALAEQAHERMCSKWRGKNEAILIRPTPQWQTDPEKDMNGRWSAPYRYLGRDNDEIVEYDEITPPTDRHIPVMKNNRWHWIEYVKLPKGEQGA